MPLTWVRDIRDSAAVDEEAIMGSRSERSQHDRISEILADLVV